MEKHKQKVEDRFQITALLLFVVSSLFYIASSLRSGDIMGLWGGIFFFLACIVFLIPFFLPNRRSKASGNRRN